MEGICFCIGDHKELGYLAGDIKMISRRRETPLVILDPGMSAPSYLEGCAQLHTNIDKDRPIREGWNVDLLVATHRSTIGKHLVQHWDRPQVKFLYQGLYAPTKEWLDLHQHLHTVWGVMDVCVRGFEKLEPWVVDASKHGEISPGARLLDLAR